MSKYDKYLAPSGVTNKYARYLEEPEKTFSPFEAGALGVRSGASLGLSDEAEGGRLARMAVAPQWVNRALSGASTSLPVAQAVAGLIDAGIGLGVEFTQPETSKSKQAYRYGRDVTRDIQNLAREERPLSYLGGEIVGGIATGPPLATAGRSSAVLAADKIAEANRLMQKAAKADAARKTALQTRAAQLSADAARLAVPAKTVGEATARVGRIAGEGALRGGAVGASYGAAYGFGNAEEEGLEGRLPQAAIGGAIGAVGGAVLTPVVQALGAAGSGIIYKLRTPDEVKALDMVLKRALRSGTDLNKIKAQFDQWEKAGEVPETLAELMGPNERGLLSALVSVNRETREQATDVVVGRGREEVNRLEEAFAKSFGAGRKDYQKTKAAAAEARAKEAEPFYDAAYIDAQTGQRKFLGQPETDQLAYEIGGSRVAQSTLSTASDYADALGKRAIRDEIDDFAAAIRAGGPIKPLSIEAADYIERGINRRLKAASSGESLDIPGGIASLRNRIRDIIDPSGLGEARATAREAIRRGELLEEGLGIMKPSVGVDDVEAIMRGIPEAGIEPASIAGRSAYGVGASRAVANELRNAPDMSEFANAARKVARTPALREKLEAARPKTLTVKGTEDLRTSQTRANIALDQAIERASNRAQFGVDLLGNSKTAFRQGDIEDAILDDTFSQQTGEVIGDLIISGAGGVAQKLQDRLGRFIGNRIGQPSIYRPQINREAANILLATGGQIPVQIKRLAERAAQKASGRLGRPTMMPPPGSPPASGQPPTPPPGTPPAPLTPGKGKLGTRAADAAAILALAGGGPTAEADTGGARAEAQSRITELSQLENEAQTQITEYQQSLKNFRNLSVVEKQEFLKANGFLGENGKPLVIDGRPEGNTAFAIKTYEAATAQAIAAAEAEREDFRSQINKARVALAERQEQPPNPLIDKLAELGTYGAMIYGAHRLRGAGLKASQKTAREIEDSANALLTRLPIPPEAPKRTLSSRVPVLGAKEAARIKKATTAANKAAQAVEERLAGRDIPPISSNPTSPNGMPIRMANLGEFDRRRAEGMFGPVSQIDRLMEPVTSRIRPADISLMAAGSADAYIMEGMLEKTRADIDAEEKRLAQARAADNGQGDPVRIEVSNKRLEELRKAETIQTIMQRVGVGLMIGGAVGIAHGRYAKAQPRFEAAERERELIRLAQTPTPVAPPPALPPMIPVPGTSGAAAPKKPRTVGKPKRPSPVSFSARKPRKPANENN